MESLLLLERARMPVRLVLYALGAMLFAYHCYTVWDNVFGANQHYVVHIAGVMAFAALFLIDRGLGTPEKRANLVDIGAGLVALLGVAVSGSYLFAKAQELEMLQPFVSSEALVLGCVLVASVLLIAWRLWGGVIAAICALACAYMLFGHLLPGAARGQPLNVAISFLSGMGGPRGVMRYASLSADMIFLLLVYGGVLHGTRVIEMFGDIGDAVGNVINGGVAYSSVLVSTLIGMVTGQAVSNIALSGVMTIPSMKKNGFSGAQAGAIEVLASTGSQLLPPIMGLGAFLMAVILGVSYIEVVVAAFIPGVLYMVTIVVGITALVGRKGTSGKVSVRVDRRKIYWILPTFIVSFVVLIALLAMRYSPSMAGFWGIATAVAMSMLRPRDYRPSLKALGTGGMIGLSTAVQLAVILAAIGLVVQTLTTTGLGISAGRLVVEVSGGNLFITLIVGLLVSLVVGMGLPTPAAYALIAIIVVPALIDAGLAPLTAHMYGFYFAIFSALTPPVAVGVLVASRIAEAGFAKTAWESVKLGGVALLLPFVFVATPTLLAPSELTLAAGLSILAYVAGTFLLAGAIYGHLAGPVSASARVAFVIAGPVALITYLFSGQYLLALVPVAVALGWAVRAFHARRTLVRSSEAI